MEVPRSPEEKDDMTDAFLTASERRKKVGNVVGIVKMAREMSENRNAKTTVKMLRNETKYINKKILAFIFVIDPVGDEGGAREEEEGLVQFDDGFLVLMSEVISVFGVPVYVIEKKSTHYLVTWQADAEKDVFEKKTSRPELLGSILLPLGAKFLVDPAVDPTAFMQQSKELNAHYSHSVITAGKSLKELLARPVLMAKDRQLKPMSQRLSDVINMCMNADYDRETISTAVYFAKHSYFVSA